MLTKVKDLTTLLALIYSVYTLTRLAVELSFAGAVGVSKLTNRVKQIRRVRAQEAAFLTYA